jgi:hypothetical protein
MKRKWKSDEKRRRRRRIKRRRKREACRVDKHTTGNGETKKKPKWHEKIRNANTHNKFYKKIDRRHTHNYILVYPHLKSEPYIGTYLHTIPEKYSHEQNVAENPIFKVIGERVIEEMGNKNSEEWRRKLGRGIAKTEKMGGRKE